MMAQAEASNLFFVKHTQISITQCRPVMSMNCRAADHYRLMYARALGCVQGECRELLFDPTKPAEADVMGETKFATILGGRYHRPKSIIYGFAGR